MFREIDATFFSIRYCLEKVSRKLSRVSNAFGLSGFQIRLSFKPRKYSVTIVALNIIHDCQSNWILWKRQVLDRTLQKRQVLVMCVLNNSNLGNNVLLLLFFFIGLSFILVCLLYGENFFKKSIIWISYG